jgi:hypothetical protein
MILGGQTASSMHAQHFKAGVQNTVHELQRHSLAQTTPRPAVNAVAHPCHGMPQTHDDCKSAAIEWLQLSHCI